MLPRSAICLLCSTAITHTRLQTGAVGLSIWSSIWSSPIMPGPVPKVLSLPAHLCQELQKDTGG